MLVVAAPVGKRRFALGAEQEWDINVRGHVLTVSLDVSKRCAALRTCVFVPSLHRSWEKGLIHFAPSSSCCKLDVLSCSLSAGEDAATPKAFVVNDVGHWSNDSVLSSQCREPLMPPQCVFGGEGHTAQTSTVRQQCALMLCVSVRLVLQRCRCNVKQALIVWARWCNIVSLPALDYPVRVQLKEFLPCVLIPNELVKVAVEAFPKGFGVGKP